jgi:hypothetical protein
LDQATGLSCEEDDVDVDDDDDEDDDDKTGYSHFYMFVHHPFTGMFLNALMLFRLFMLLLGLH